MDKNSATNIITNARMNTYQIAHSIYLATVQGVSGANQNDGYGFALSAIAELWNIRGTIGNPYGRTKITGRYRGMGVTEDMIRNVVSHYPNGIQGYEPTFDDLLGIGAGGARTVASESSPEVGEELLKKLGIIMLILLVICKLFLGWGWIGSIIVAVIGGCIIWYKIFGKDL